MAVSVAEFKDLKCNVDEHEKFINGNGTIGAKTRLTLIETTLKRLDDNINKAVGWIIGGAITLIVGVLIWIFTNLIPKLLAG